MVNIKNLQFLLHFPLVSVMNYLDIADPCWRVREEPSYAKVSLCKTNTELI